jgi:LysM repeat protein
MVIRALASVAAVVLAAPAVASAAFPHVVEPGESLSSVAASDGLTVEQLAAANGLSTEAPLIAGTTLMIPGQGQTAEEPATAEDVEAAETEATQATEGEQQTPQALAEGGSVVVQPGETLSEIAARVGTTVEGLAVLNGIEENALLLAGTALRVPSGTLEPTGTGEPTQAAASPPYPTEETVAPSEVGAIAEEHGVPASFAEAIAEQESGFNNGLTSSADARGVMQIVPETWNWINQNLVGPPPLEPASATSNVQGGVLLLHWLLNASGGDPAQAAAGYYQGIESVRQEGELPETEQYVGEELARRRQYGGE